MKKYVYLILLVIASDPKLNVLESAAIFGILRLPRRLRLLAMTINLEATNACLFFYAAIVIFVGIVI